MLMRAGPQRGTSLVEVLVSLLLLSLGVLSVAGLQARLSLQAGAVQYRAVASQLALDFSERLRANAPGVVAGAYDAGVAPEASAATGPRECASACGPAELALADVHLWRALAADQLPDGRLWIVRDSALQPMVVEVWVGWRPDPMPGAAADEAPLLGGCALPGAAGLDCLQLRQTL